MDEFEIFTVTLANVKKKWVEQVSGLSLIYHVKDNPEDPFRPVFVLHLLCVPLSHRRRGYGSQVMEDLTLICDRFNVPMELEASSTIGTPLTALVSFYRAHSFFITNPIIDNDSVKMYRMPVWDEAQ